MEQLKQIDVLLDKGTEAENGKTQTMEDKTKMERLSYDDVLKMLGEFGKYQKFQYFLICLVSITSALQSFNMVFVGATPDHHCQVDNVPTHWQNLTTSQKDNLTYPWTSDRDSWKMSSCQMYNISEVDWSEGNYSNWDMTNITRMKCPNGYVYSTKYYNSTIVSEVSWTFCINQLPADQQIKITFKIDFQNFQNAK